MGRSEKVGKRVAHHLFRKRDCCSQKEGFLSFSAVCSDFFKAMDMQALVIAERRRLRLKSRKTKLATRPGRGSSSSSSGPARRASSSSVADTTTSPPADFAAPGPSNEGSSRTFRQRSQESQRCTVQITCIKGVETVGWHGSIGRDNGLRVLVCGHVRRNECDDYA